MCGNYFKCEEGYLKCGFFKCGGYFNTSNVGVTSNVGRSFYIWVGYFKCEGG